MRNLRLDKKIEQSGLKKVYVAMLARVHPSELSHILSGRMNATAEEKSGLAKALKCKVKEIF